MAPYATILLAAVPLLFVYLYTALKWRRFKQFAALPQPKSDLIWGHMKFLHERIQSGGAVGDTKRHTDMVFSDIRKELGNPPVLFMDVRPAGYPMLVITNNEVAEQISRVSKRFPYSVPKSPTLSNLGHLVGPQSILMTENEQWKTIRRRFNPGFAPQHLMTLLPCILEKTEHFLEHLDRFVKTGEEFHMDYYATGLTFDIIGSVVMDIDFGAQGDEQHQSEILKLFRALIATYGAYSNLPDWCFPHVQLRRWRLSRGIHQLLRKFVQEKYEAQKRELADKKKARSVLSLSLQGVDRLDAHLADSICDQLKTFLFAGHDTTSILLQWIFFELSRTPRALTAVRAELDGLFGPSTDPAVVRDALLAPGGDELLSRMPYTSAVIKETLRLYPPAGTARYVPPGTGFTVAFPNGGGEKCIDGLVLYNCAYAIQRDESVYGSTANVFVPERWLGNTDTSMATNDNEEVAVDEKTNGKSDAGKGSEQKIPPGAWRPFERGPRNCIGQELANIEARVILACTVRRYDFIKVGQGETLRDEKGVPVLDENGQYKVKSPLYNVMQVTSKPSDGCLVRVRLTEKALQESR